MSVNAEPKASMATINRAEWATVPEREKLAIRAAIRAYAESPGDDANCAMMRACRIYVQRMKNVAPESAK